MVVSESILSCLNGLAEEELRKWKMKSWEISQRFLLAVSKSLYHLAGSTGRNLLDRSREFQRVSSR